MADFRSVHAGVTIASAPAAVRYSLRSRTPEGLPKILASAPFAGGHALGLGPDEWLVILPEGTATPAGTYALTDISDRNIGLMIEGRLAETLLQAGIALDLSLPAFPIGKVTRTLHEGVEIILWRINETAFRVETWRSFAEHLFGSLVLTAGDL
jgi:sarcosine oxidase subunit gamma